MKVLISFAVFFLFSPAIFAQTNKPVTDFQWWNDLQVIVPVRTTINKNKKKIDNVLLNFDGIVRFGRNASFPVDDRFSATLDFRINKFLKISPAYLYQKFEQFPHQRTYEQRLSGAINLEKKFDLFTLRHRSMFEYRLRNSRPDTQVYRARFQAAYSLKREEKEIFSPFVSEEIYYDRLSRSWNRSEFFAGVTRKLNAHISLDLFYIWIDSKTLDANAIGTTLKFRLW